MTKKPTYTIEATFPGGPLERTHVKIITLKENASLDAGWEPIVVSFHDDGSRYMVNGTWTFDMNTPLPVWQQQLFAILAKVYDFGSELFKNWSTLPPDEQLKFVTAQMGTVIITEHAEKPLQEWRMTGAWPHSVNFGELCYSSDPSVDIEVTWRFQKCTNTHFADPQ